MTATKPPLPDSAASTPKLIAACELRNRARPPVWIMRQAGRYLPEYQNLRKKYSFVEMCTVPDLAVEVSLQPYRRFGFDGVIVFYDILFLAAAMGAPLEFTDKGPVFRRPIRSRSEVESLRQPDLEALDPAAGTGAILESLRSVRAEVPEATAVLGFGGAPFTVASYLIEGSFQRSGDRIKRMLHEDPKLIHELLEKLASVTGDYLVGQVAAGASAVQLFDTWAGLLSAVDFREFALPYQKAVLDRVAETGAPAILYVNGASHLTEELASSGATVLSLDWRTSLPEARRILGADIGLQGNLDPASLFGPPEVVKQKVAALLDSMQGDPGYIVNLGHGILPETPVASVEALVEAVRK